MARIANEDFFEQVARAFAAGDPHLDQKQDEADQVRCIQLLYHGIARGAFDEMLTLTTDDFTLEIVGPPHCPLVGKWQGHAEVLPALEQNFSQVAGQQPEIQSVVAQGNMVVVIARERGKVAATGKPYDVLWVQEFIFENQKISHVRQIMDSAADFDTAQP